MIVTPLGAFDPNPVPGQQIIPRNFGQGPAFFSVNFGVSKTIKFGRAIPPKTPPRCGWKCRDDRLGTATATAATPGDRQPKAASQTTDSETVFIVVFDLCQQRFEPYTIVESGWEHVLAVFSEVTSTSGMFFFDQRRWRLKRKPKYYPAGAIEFLIPAEVLGSYSPKSESGRRIWDAQRISVEFAESPGEKNVANHI